jgi:hypothetical protein
MLWFILVADLFLAVRTFGIYGEFTDETTELYVNGPTRLTPDELIHVQGTWIVWGFMLGVALVTFIAVIWALIVSYRREIKSRKSA